MKHIVVTGAGGFVGRKLCAALLHEAYQVTGLVRRPDGLLAGVVPWVLDTDGFAGLADAWRQAGPSCDCVIHLAARVHQMRDKAPDAQALYRATNVEATLQVARAARQAGARRFVFVSSIKALGDGDRGTPWREDDVPLPMDAYGSSKREAEEALFAYGREVGLEIVVVRPPLVYGPGVRANFLRLLQAVANGVPLPLGAVTAPRSLLYVGNLADALLRCVAHPAAANRVFHVCDGADMTTAELVRALARLANRPARLIPMPVQLLRLAGRLCGKSDEVERLVSPLRVDGSRIRQELGWYPPYSVEQGLMETVAWYRTTDR